MQTDQALFLWQPSLEMPSFLPPSVLHNTSIVYSCLLTVSFAACDKWVKLTPNRIRNTECLPISTWENLSYSATRVPVLQPTGMDENQLWLLVFREKWELRLQFNACVFGGKQQHLNRVKYIYIYIKIVLDLNASPEGCAIKGPGQDSRVKPYILIWQLKENTKCMGNNVMTMDAIN